MHTVMSAAYKLYFLNWAPTFSRDSNYIELAILAHVWRLFYLLTYTTRKYCYRLHIVMIRPYTFVDDPVFDCKQIGMIPWTNISQGLIGVAWNNYVWLG